jgi:uncharacterized protein (TIGR02145 family)
MQINNNKSGFFLIILIAFFAVHFTACNEKVSDPAVPETDSITDIDGNIYMTVKIGDHWWMAENLKVTHYKNGDTIECVSKNKPDATWSNLQTGAYCYMNKDFGLLYNFYSINDPRGIVPQGWHIPSDEEWKEMEIKLGMSRETVDSTNWRGSDQGNKLKAKGGSTQYWLDAGDTYRVFGTNESGFNAKGGSARIFNGLWGDLNHNAFWWTSSSVNNNEAWYRGLDYNKTNVFRFSGSKKNGFSLRCIKD